MPTASRRLFGEGEDGPTEVVRNGLGAFVAVAHALAAIRRSTPRFDAWCRAEFGADLADAVRALRAPVKSAAAKPAKDHAVKRILTAFDAAWKDKYSTDYLRTNAGAEARAAKLLAAFPADHVERWVGAYLASDKPFYAESRHGFLLFVRTINEWRAAPLARAQARSVPDADRTRDYLRDLRQGGRR